MIFLWLLFLIPASLGTSIGTGVINEYNVENGTWSSYSSKLEMHFLIDNITESLKLPTMILLMGDDAYEVLVNLAAPQEPMELTYTKANELLEQHLDATSPAVAGRYSFRARKQNYNETVLEYVAEIQKLARNCNFGKTLGVNLRDQLVYGLKNASIRLRLFMEDDRLTFPAAVKIASEMEVEQNKTTTQKEQSSTEESNEDDEVCPPPNAQTPFVCSIPGGIYPGRSVRVKGSTAPTAKRFNINLKCGPTKTWELDDVAVHVDFRFESNVVARNSMNGSLPTFYERWTQWAEETYGGMPISPGDSFEVELLCLKDYFKIIINGEHFAVFYHHMPPTRITHLVMVGDVSVQSVTYETEAM